MMSVKNCAVICPHQMPSRIDQPLRENQTPSPTDPPPQEDRHHSKVRVRDAGAPVVLTGVLGALVPGARLRRTEADIPNKASRFV
jgi:hypothetical protein